MSRIDRRTFLLGSVAVLAPLKLEPPVELVWLRNTTAEDGWSNIEIAAGVDCPGPGWEPFCAAPMNIPAGATIDGRQSYWLTRTKIRAWNNSGEMVAEMGGADGLIDITPAG